ncbi:MAG: sulfatase-like hydrolase/transferase, partial [Nanoarchaeota archaeon]
MNIIFIIVDGLRPDHLGINGYSRDTSPTIDKIAEKSIFFTNAITAIPSTTPS